MDGMCSMQSRTQLVMVECVASLAWLLSGLQSEDLCRRCGRILIIVNYGTFTLMKNLVFVKASNQRQDTQISALG